MAAQLTPGITPKNNEPTPRTQPSVTQPPPAAVVTTTKVVTTTVGTTPVATPSTSMASQPLSSTLPSRGTVPPVVMSQASQRPSSVGVTTKCPVQAPLSDQPPSKVQVLAAGIEAINAPTDPSQPVMVTIAWTVVSVPTQSSSSGSLSYVGTGLQPPPSLFQQKSAPPPTPCIIGTIHNPVVGQPSVVLSRIASGGGHHPPTPAQPTHILPPSLIGHEDDDDLQILPIPPHS